MITYLYTDDSCVSSGSPRNRHHNGTGCAQDLLGKMPTSDRRERGKVFRTLCQADVYKRKVGRKKDGVDRASDYSTVLESLLEKSRGHSICSVVRQKQPGERVAVGALHGVEGEGEKAVCQLHFL